MKYKKNFAITVLTALFLNASAQKETALLVNTQKPIAPIAPTMWGVFFEDINLGADGGIYAELVKNRSFEFSNPLMGWSVKGKKFAEGDVLIQNRQEQQISNPRFLRLNVKQAVKGDAGITNEGFRGMGIKKDIRYDFSFMYRQLRGNVTLHLELVDDKNNILGSGTLKPNATNNNWNKQETSFVSNATVEKAKLNIWFEGDGLIDVDMISLFPSDTWKDRKGGMRKDMIQMLADMKPGFIRFPGGCIVEGIDLANRYQWKKTIGPLEDRQLIMNRWNVEFGHRPTPDYFQTFGLGFYEYFQLAEDIGAEPLPILNCGMACQYNTGEVVPLDQLGPYIQDALDLIEFANGDATTEWGKKRIAMGHKAPFNLKYLGVGNENWGPQYIERAKLFQDKIKAKYPNIELIYSSGTDPDSERYHFLDKQLRSIGADIIDEHYYRSPDWFLKNAARYDSFDRKGPKIFAGEYAAHVDGKITGSNRNIWQAAIAEAAFMTGLERNAEIVTMASYAPLFAHGEGWQWAPDLIWVNNLNVYGTPNYEVQKMFSLNKGTHVLNASFNGKPLTGENGLYASSVIDESKKEIIVKVVNTTNEVKNQSVAFSGD
ncbi:MAG: alpha-L-arabinofuranosidase, partial [Flavobacterium sp.]